MRTKILLAVVLCFGMGAPLAHSQASPYSNSVFAAKIFTASGQTTTPIQLNGLVVPSTVGSSFASGTITVTGTSLTTATFAVQGSSDNGATYYALPIYVTASPTTTPATSITVTANGLYQINLAGLTHIKFVTSGTFTATNVTLTLTASPNGMVARGNSSGGGPPTGAAGGSLAGTYPNPSLATVNSSPGTCGDSTHSCQVVTNAAGQTTSQTAIAIAANGTTPEYMTTSQSPLGSWTRALDNCANQVVHLAFLWDSYGIAYTGFGSTGPANYYDRVPDQWFAYLKSRCPVHGTGLVPPIGYLIPGSPLPNPLYFAFTGTAGFSTALGPWTSVGSTLLTAQVGNVLTFTTSTTAIATDTFKAYCAQGPSYGTWNISVDSGAHTGTCGGSAGSPTAQLATVTEGTSSTSHSVTLTCATAQCALWAVEGTNGSVGIEVDNVSFGSGNSTMWSQTHAFDFLDLITGGIQGMVVKFQTNDPNQGVSTGQYTTALEAIATHEQATASNPGIGILTAPVSNPAGGCGMGSTMPSYSAAALTAATTSGTAYTDILHNWGTTYISSLFASDGCHPTESGSFSEFSLTKRMMVDVEPTNAGTGGAALLASPNTFTATNTFTGPNVTTTDKATSGVAAHSIDDTAAGGPAYSQVAWLHGFDLIEADTTSLSIEDIFYNIGGVSAPGGGSSPGYTWKKLGDQSCYGWSPNSSANGTFAAVGDAPKTCIWGNAGGAAKTISVGNSTQNDHTGHLLIGDVNAVALSATGAATEYLDHSGNYSVPAGVTVTGTSPIVVSGTVISCPSCSTGSGTNVTINGGGALGTAGLNATTPAAPGGNTNCTWQVSGTSVSCYVPTSGSDYKNFTSTLTPTGCTVSGNLCTVSGTPSSITLAGIPSGTYSNLVIKFNGSQSNASTSIIDVQFNSDTTGGNYDHLYCVNVGGTGSPTCAITGSSAGIPLTDASGTNQAHSASSQVATVLNYAGTTFYKQVSGSPSFGWSTTPISFWPTGQWRSQTAITSITLIVDGGGNFATGTTVSVSGSN